MWWLEYFATSIHVTLYVLVFQLHVSMSGLSTTCITNEE